MKRLPTLLILLIIFLSPGLTLGEEGKCLEGDCVNGPGTYEISEGSLNGSIY